jgi:hypothetical protein
MPYLANDGEISCIEAFFKGKSTATVLSSIHNDSPDCHIWEETHAVCASFALGHSKASQCLSSPLVPKQVLHFARTSVSRNSHIVTYSSSPYPFSRFLTLSRSKAYRVVVL